jgi:hypothetical protein
MKGEGVLSKEEISQGPHQEKLLLNNNIPMRFGVQKV